jgi:phosphate transport system permease protein
MTQGQTDDAPAQQTPPRNFRSKRLRILGLDSDDFVRAFFGGNATLAIVVLVLIMAFLFRESAGFFGSYAKEMESYRRSGLELVDCMRTQLGDYNALTREVSTLEAHKIATLMKEGATLEEARMQTARLRELATQMRTIARSQTKLVDGLTKYAVTLRDEYKTTLIRQENRENLRGDASRAERQGDTDAAAKLRAEADAIDCPDPDLAARREHIIGAVPQFVESNTRLREDLAGLLDGLVSIEVLDEGEAGELRGQATKFIEASFVTEERLREWNADEPVPLTARLTSFLFGRRWITNSFFQDWYGVLPLLSGSLMISFIALMIAVPLGIAGAIHVNQFAGRREQAFIKPYIEFISAIPSVVIGFFGVIVWGEFVREASGWDALSWIPGFPISERLNAFTAGCLLALMAVPTIFTLAEDALNNVPTPSRRPHSPSAPLGCKRRSAS